MFKKFYRVNRLNTFSCALLSKFGMGVLLVTVFALSGCGGGGDAASPPSLTGITITPGSATVTNGQSSHFTAQGSYSNATVADVTNRVSWYTTNSAIAVIDSSGRVTGKGIGNTTVTATLGNVSSTGVALTVTAIPPASLSISPSAIAVEKGQSVTFTATGTYTDGSTGNLSGSVSWVSSNPSVSTVGLSGIATTLGQGTTSITATVNGILLATATLTVTNTAPVADAGANRNILIGSSVILDGRASRDANNDPLTYSWTLTSKPALSTATLSNSTLVNPTFTADLAGKYVLSLVVNDGTVNSTPAVVTFRTLYTTPLHTSGASIVDANGIPVDLHGVNWAGFETNGSPHGLDANSVDQILDKIASLGFNLIRLPLSSFYVGSLNPNPTLDRLPSASQYWATVNYPALIKNPAGGIGSQAPIPSIQILDYVIQRAKAKNIYVLLDRHRASAAHQCGHWDTTSILAFYRDAVGVDWPCSTDGVTVTEAQWIADWQVLATRYNGSAYDNVIGAELHNEPDFRVNWGKGDADDWHLAAQRCGNAIQTVNTNWLIFVQGIGGPNAYGYAVPATVPPTVVNVDAGVNYWWGGNLRGVKDFPVILTVPNKVVYAIHEYGPGVHPHLWFPTATNPVPTYPANLTAMWDANWGYIATQNIAPIFFTEFGGKLFDGTSPEGVWQNMLVDYMIAKNFRHYTYWELGPYSIDTEGLLTNWNGLLVNQPKVNQIINRLLR